MFQRLAFCSLLVFGRAFAKPLANAQISQRGLPPLSPTPTNPFGTSSTKAMPTSTSPIPTGCAAWKLNAFSIRVDYADGSGTLGYMPAYGVGWPVPYPGDEASAACFAPYGGTLTAGSTTGFQVHIDPDPQYYVLYSPQNSKNWTPSNPSTGNVAYQHEGLIYIQNNPINDPGRGEELPVWSLVDGSTDLLQVNWVSDGQTYHPKLFAKSIGGKTIVAQYDNIQGYPEVVFRVVYLDK